MAGDAKRLGLYGFGAAAHLAIQTAQYRGQDVFAFTRPGDNAGQEFARSLGAVWAGDSTQMPPEKLDAAIIFAPVGLVPQALQAVRKAGVVVCGGIHMSDIPSFPYDILWGERVSRSVANLTHRDGEEFLELAPQVPVHTVTERFPLSEANTAWRNSGRATSKAPPCSFQVSRDASLRAERSARRLASRLTCASVRRGEAIP